MIINSLKYLNTKNIIASVSKLNLININTITNTISINKQIVSGSTQIADSDLEIQNIPIPILRILK